MKITDENDNSYNYAKKLREFIGFDLQADYKDKGNSLIFLLIELNANINDLKKEILCYKSTEIKKETLDQGVCFRLF